MATTYDAIIIDIGQAGPSLASCATTTSSLRGACGPSTRNTVHINQLE
jgi:hypothetical protein